MKRELWYTDKIALYGLLSEVMFEVMPIYREDLDSSLKILQSKRVGT